MRASFALLLLLGACASPGPRPAPTSGPDAGPCTPLPPGALAPGGCLLLGEVHGTRELPALFGELACGAAIAPLTVGLELPSSEQPRVDAFLASAGGPAARAGLLAGPFWTRAYQDGRSSEAMAALLEELRRLRSAGRAVEVTLFDDGAGGAGRDQRMAEALAARVRARPEAACLALTGNFHARTRPGAPWSPTQRWMGSYLRDSGVPTLGFDLGGQVEGTAWVCASDDPRECGPRPWRVRSPLPGGARRGAALLGEETPEGYAGLWAVETLTASPPAPGAAR